MNSDRPVPADFKDIEDWILHYVFKENQQKHTTQALLDQLTAILKAEPSRLEECNRGRGLLGARVITEEEYTASRTPNLAAVQRAAQELYIKKWIRANLSNNSEGVVLFTDIAITKQGLAEALRRAHEREDAAKPKVNFERIIEKIHKNGGHI